VIDARISGVYSHTILATSSFSAFSPAGQPELEPLAHVLPDPLDGIELRTVRRQPEKHDVVGDDERAGDVRGGTVDHQHVHALAVDAGELVDEYLEAGRIQRRHLEEERLSRGGLGRAEEPEGLVAGQDQLVRLHPRRGDEAARDAFVQAETGFVLDEEPHREPREGDDCVEEAGQEKGEVGGVTVVFFRCRGRARFSFAPR
jgi:hypothetical protein